MMKRQFMWMLVTFILSSIVLYADDALVQIGCVTYTGADLMEVMEIHHYSMPDEAIEKLQQDQVLSDLGKTRRTLFREMFDLDHDFDCPDKNRLMQDTCESDCLFIFHRWLAEKARSVPVVFVNPGGFWNLVRETEAYEIRTLHGRNEMSQADIFYTPAELWVDGDRVMAGAGAQLYVSGREFNQVILENYTDFFHLLKRDKSIDRARFLILKELVEEKVASELYRIQSGDFSELEIEEMVDSLARTKMFSQNTLYLPKKKYQGLDEMLSELAHLYKQKHVNDLNQFRSALGGGPSPRTESFDASNQLRKIKGELFFQKRTSKQSAQIGWHNDLEPQRRQEQDRLIREYMKERGITLHLTEG